MLSVTGNIPASEMIFVGPGLNGHVDANADGYDEVHGFGVRNAAGK